MRVVRYRLADGPAEMGCVVDDGVHAIDGDPLDSDAAPGERVAALADVRLLAPCEPSKVVAIAINFPAMENFVPGTTEPMVFVMPPTTVCGPGDPVVNPFPELPWWGEAEMAVVLRRRLRHASAETVREAVLGFTVANDPTVQNVEGRDHHLARSKCSDGFCPLGPWIDTEFDGDDALVEAVQNGEIIRRGRTSEQLWQWPRILEWLSGWMTLEPWDVVLTGNPPDTVGMRYVHHGDTYTARVEGLGELTNTFYLAGRDPDV
jgi:2-keto-4-pentenoate hydratase/2-oxohepta-3-ene-1,7-dioic acid hydratase in catechol pathway